MRTSLAVKSNLGGWQPVYGIKDKQYVKISRGEEAVRLRKIADIQHWMAQRAACVNEETKALSEEQINDLVHELRP